MNPNLHSKTRIFVAGHKGLVGSAVVRELRRQGYDNLVLRSKAELDLCDQAATMRFYREEKPELVVFAAGLVGGIDANRHRHADFLHQNLAMAMNSIHAAFLSDVQKFIYLGSACIYPREAAQPIAEDALLSGPLEPTNEGYAIAKIAALKMCEFYHRQYGRNFVSMMPNNLYGPGDRVHDKDSHVISALMHRIHNAKTENRSDVVVWGSGRPKREFLHSDDLARAILLVAKEYSAPETINVGSGEEVSIHQLAEILREVIGYKGRLVFDSNYPDGTPRKFLSSAKIQALGWKPAIPLAQGLQDLYQNFSK